MYAGGHGVTEKGCRDLEECKGPSFSSRLIDGLQILMGGGTDMSPNKGKEDGVFFFILVSVWLFLWSFITAVTLDEELKLAAVTQSEPTS